MHLSTPPSTPRLPPAVQTTLGWSIRWTPASQYSREHSTGVEGNKCAVKLQPFHWTTSCATVRVAVTSDPIYDHAY